MAVQLKSFHHVALICSNYEQSKRFYTEVLGLTILAEHYRSERASWKLDLGMGDAHVLEVFSFPDPPARSSRPEACGLRHLAFGVDDLEVQVGLLHEAGVQTEEIRVDAFTGKRFCFFSDPDGLPLELYERS